MWRAPSSPRAQRQGPRSTDATRETGETIMSTWKANSNWDELEEEEDSGLNSLPDVRPARLLLAEDDDELRRSIAGQLRRKGYEVDEAFSGFEAIALIARQEDPYDL